MIATVASTMLGRLCLMLSLPIDVPKFLIVMFSGNLSGCILSDSLKRNVLTK